MPNRVGEFDIHTEIELSLHDKVFCEVENFFWFRFQVESWKECLVRVNIKNLDFSVEDFYFLKLFVVWLFVSP